MVQETLKLYFLYYSRLNVLKRCTYFGKKSTKLSALHAVQKLSILVVYNATQQNDFFCMVFPAKDVEGDEKLSQLELFLQVFTSLICKKRYI